MKYLILKIIYHLGFVRLWCLFRRKKITILMLHGVMDSGVDCAWEPLRPRTSRQLFDETLGLAVRYFNFVSIDEASDMLKGTIPVKSNSCVVTFDDGQLNNLEIALPILRKYEIPVVFYPTTGILERSVPYWFDRLDFAIQQPGLDGVKIQTGETEITVDQSSRAAMSKSLSRLIRSLKKRDLSDAEFQAQVDEISTFLEHTSGSSIASVVDGDLWSSRLSRADLMDCAAMNDVTLGSHTINHVRVPFVESDDELAKELKGSKEALEEMMQGPCHHFCYPNGDWDPRSVRAVRDAGYHTAVTTDEGVNAVGDDLYTLKRYSFPVKGEPIKGLFTIMGFFHFISSRRFG
ncbi:MAG: polysaccharide deacetylase family protein [Candidatus Thiodiazotropha sp.]